MTKTRIKGYIKSFTEDEVKAMVVIDENHRQVRIFDVYPLFAEMELFEHKNFLLEIIQEGNSQTCRCLESSESKVQQIINAWHVLTSTEEI